MAPIPTAIIGLSANSASSWGASAHLPYLLSAHGRARYTIVALLNSSKESSLAAVKHFNLPAETRAYGSPEELAADKDVRLVVCSTRVDKHYGTVLASAKAGKDVYVEWPLAQDTKHAKELADVARHGGGRTLVGLQGRVSPLTLRLKKLIEDGRIGKVLSTEVRGSGGTNSRDSVPKGLEYFVKRSVGGNIVTIHGGHAFDLIQTVLGEAIDIKSQLQLQRPINNVRDPATDTVIDTVKADVPDLYIVTARLAESPTVVRDASLLFRFRRGAQFSGEPALVWSITGEKGEIRVTNQASSSLHVPPAGIVVEVHDFETDKVEKVDWELQESWPGDAKAPAPSKNVGLLYDSFAAGGKYPTWDDAVHRHEQIDRFLSGWAPEA
ncbi:unnamed protein product [Mycena citricolor]|uniref:Gfo/Idh/MocA-like oxidoreductase N-terminal domain-containing protein n=1 Tax=Mycena citricolor TaxID=2018698 RepID=A0AAD2HET8_9AGAR|nr:unnamed protein product [Mycena citricolor]